MTLEYKEIAIHGYLNTTDKFGLLIGYVMNIYTPLIPGANIAQIAVVDPSNNVVDKAGITVLDNGLTQTYVQIQTSNANPKPLLVPPGYSLSAYTDNGVVANYGMLLLGTLDEIARVAIR